MRENRTVLIYETMKEVSEKMILHNRSTSKISSDLLYISDLLLECIDEARDDVNRFESDVNLVDEYRTIINSIDDIEIGLVEGDDPYHLRNRLKDEIDVFEKIANLS